MMTHHLQNIAQSSKTASLFGGVGGAHPIPSPIFAHISVQSGKSKKEEQTKKNIGEREREREKERKATQHTRARAHKKRSKRWEKKKELCANPRVILLLLFERARVYSL